MAIEESFGLEKRGKGSLQKIIDYDKELDEMPDICTFFQVNKVNNGEFLVKFRDKCEDDFTEILISTIDELNEIIKNKLY